MLSPCFSPPSHFYFFFCVGPFFFFSNKNIQQAKKSGFSNLGKYFQSATKH